MSSTCQYWASGTTGRAEHISHIVRRMH